MLYEAESHDFTLAATGDAMLVRKMRLFREKRFLAMVELAKGADAAYTNLEMLFHRWEGPPGRTTDTYTASDPANLEELKWMGFGFVSCANNHSYDYGEQGLLSTIRHLDTAGIVHAGTGRNLAEARGPAYLDTPKGRVAILSATSTATEFARATEQRPDMQGRPGVSVLGHQVIYTVDRQAFDELRRISKGVGQEAEKEWRQRFGFTGSHPADTDTEFHFLGQKFVLGEEFKKTSVPSEADVKDILRWVRDARRMADWVVFSLHSHEWDASREDPADFMVTFARRCIDEGVDVFLGHGPHFLRGIEVYKGRPIFYSLGNFIFQNDNVGRLPHDSYVRFGLGYESTPADFFEARSGKDSRGFAVAPIYWESVVAVTAFKGGGLEEVRLYPIDMGYGRPRWQRGRPLLANGEVGQRVLERLARFSKPLGPEVAIKDGVGIIRS